MSRIIVITSGKGGVGKTTTTSNIGMALARLNHKTLLIDADIGLRNLDLLLGLENRIIYTGNDVLKGTCRLEQALIQDKRQPNLTFFPIASSQSKIPVTKHQLQELIEILQEKFDFTEHEKVRLTGSLGELGCAGLDFRGSTAKNSQPTDTRKKRL